MKDISDDDLRAQRFIYSWLQSYFQAFGRRPTARAATAEVRKAYAEFTRPDLKGNKPTPTIFLSRFGENFVHILNNYWSELEDRVRAQKISGQRLKVSYHPQPKMARPVATNPAVVGAAVGYRLDEHGRPKAEIGNVVAALGDPQLSGADIRFDAFRAELMVSPPGQNAWRPLVDGDAVELRIRLARQGFPPLGREMMRDALTLAARDRQFDTAVEWLEYEVPPWDGVPRVATALSDYFRVHDEPYSQAVSEYLFTAMAGRVLSPGCQADMVVILVGGQGVGKSTAAAALSPHTDFFGELSFSEKDADQSRAIRGKLVLELSELRGLKTRDAESIKGLITRRHERWTPKYKEYETAYPRRCVFIGTTNSTEFLADETGERRWLPVRVEGQIDIAGLKAALPQLWAEGRELCRQHGVIWKKAQELAASRHVEFKDTDPWQERVLQWLAAAGHMGLAPPPAPTTLEILVDALGFEERHIGTREKQRMTRILREAGFERRSVWKDNHSRWAWVFGSRPHTPSRQPAGGV